MSLLKAIEEERNRLTEQLKKLAQEKTDIDNRILEINQELKAINAYESTKTGKVKAKPARTRQTGIKQSILDLLTQAPHGLGRAGIIDGLGFRGDKGKEQTVSNTLANMKKANAITVTDGVYTIP